MTAAPPRTRVLLVDDLPRTRIAAKWFLEHFNYSVEVARDLPEALSKVSPRAHDLVVVPADLGSTRPEELESLIRVCSNEVPVFLHGTDQQKFHEQRVPFSDVREVMELAWGSLGFSNSMSRAAETAPGPG